jgi:hypothetical protein
VVKVNSNLNRIRLPFSKLLKASQELFNISDVYEPQAFIMELVEIFNPEVRVRSDLAKLDLISQISMWVFENCHPDNKSKVFDLSSGVLSWRRN